MIVLLIIFLVLLAVYLWAVFPAKPNRTDFSPFDHALIAHRGLFSVKDGIPENTMTAFRKAVEAGYGIETDVHVTKDDRLVITHDASLKRVYGVDLIVEDHTLEEVRAVICQETGEPVPTFEEFLSCVAGRVPLILELKGTKAQLRMVPLVAEALKDYPGDYCIESFDPYLMHEVKRCMPDVTRGFLSSLFSRDGHRSPLYLMSQWLMFNFYTRPDFIAYSFEGAHHFQLFLVCKVLRCKAVAWTVRTPDDFAKAKDYFDTLICENLSTLPGEEFTKRT